MLAKEVSTKNTTWTYTTSMRVILAAFEHLIVYFYN